MSFKLSGWLPCYCFQVWQRFISLSDYISVKVILRTGAIVSKRRTGFGLIAVFLIFIILISHHMFSERSVSRRTWMTFFPVLLLLSFSGSVMAQPVISTISPVSGTIGSSVTITGSGFNATPSNNIVWFGSARALVTSASGSSLTATVPAGFSQQPITVTTNNHTAFSPVPFVVTFPGGNGPFTTGSFVPGTIPLSAVAYDIDGADLDGDNKPELVVLNYVINTVSVYKNACTTSSIDFSTKVDFPAATQPGSVALQDMDGDGLKDMVIGNIGFGAYSISIFRNTSSGGVISFAPKIDFPVSDVPYKVVVAEIDGDGKPDIISTNVTNILVFRNLSSPGSISLAPVSVVNAAGNTNGLAVIDVNANGKADIITCNYYTPAVNVISNNSTPGNISFAAPLPFTTGSGPKAVAVGNLDDDDKPDMAVLNSVGNVISVFKNTGTGNTVSFAPKQDLNNGNQPWDIEIVDMNGDGKLDLCHSNLNNPRTVSIFRNISSGSAISFDTRIDYGTIERNKEIVVIDLTGDGRPDIATTPYISSTNIISVFRNKMGDAPTMTSFTPLSGGETTVITIKGTNLAGANASSIGGMAATAINVMSDTSMTVNVGTGNSGNVSITTPAGTVSLPGFVFTTPPSITSFTPLSGPVGQVVKISGSNFSPDPNDNTVYFGAAKATIISGNSTTIYVRVPAGATYQPLSLSTRNYTLFAKKPFNITFPDGSISSTTFVKKIHKTEADVSSFGILHFADIDMDGKNDLVSGKPLGLVVYRNTTVNGMVSLAPRVSFNSYPFLSPGHFATADFDGDGKLDAAMTMIIHGGNTGYIDVFRNTSIPGTISFDAPKYFTTGSYPVHIAVGDLDDDGKPDLAVVNNSSTYISVFRNTSSPGNTSFALQIPFPVRNFNTACTYIGDVDGDGRADIISTNLNDSTISIFRNTTSTVGAISMAPRLDLDATYRNTFVSMGDIDGDGKADMILSSGYYGGVGAGLTDSNIMVFRNLSTPGSISFAPVAKFITSIGPYNVALNDLDGDGKPDMIGGDGSEDIWLLKNTSQPGIISFAPVLKYYGGDVPLGMSCGDLDGDGKPDFVIGNDNPGGFDVFINQNGSDLPLCPGGNTTVTSNLVGTTYQWQVDEGSGFNNLVNGPNYAGANTSALNLINVPSSWRGYRYRCLVNSVSSKIFTIKFVNQWTGAVNSSWENPGNWSCGIIPDNNTDVIISFGPVVINSDVTIWSLKIDTDVVFTVTTGYTLTVLH
jgi:large repetitive protein